MTDAGFPDCSRLRPWAAATEQAIKIADFWLCGMVSALATWRRNITLLPPMKESLWLSLASACLFVFTSCASKKDDFGLADTGPFDEHGNYRDEWADDPTKWRRPSGRKSKPVEATSIAVNDQPPSNAVPLPSAGSRPPSSSRTSVTPPKPKPKTSTTAYKPKPKSKPQSTRYTVKSGDSLYAIAKRNGTSVSALQKANGISGSMIRPGQKLVVPKR